MAGQSRQARGPYDEIYDFIRKEKERGLKNTTLEVYRKDLESLCNYLKEHYTVTLLETMPQHIERYLTHRKQQGMLRETVNRRIHTFKSFFTYMCNAGLMEGNPMDGVPVAQLRDKSSFLPVGEKPSSLKTQKVGLLLGQIKIPKLS